MKQYRETFNDGFLAFGRKETIRSNGKRVGERFIEDGKLAFKEMSCRDGDYQMAGILGASLDMKVKTLYHPRLRSVNKSKLKVKINNTEFDVIKADNDKNRSFLFFYLQEVGVVREQKNQTIDE